MEKMQTIDREIFKQLGQLSDQAYSIFWAVWDKVESANSPEIEVTQVWLKYVIDYSSNDYYNVIARAAKELERFVTIERKQVKIADVAKSYNNYRHTYTFKFKSEMFKSIKNKRGNSSNVSTPSISVIRDLAKIKYGLKIYIFQKSYFQNHTKFYDEDFRQIFGFSDKYKTWKINHYIHSAVVEVGKLYGFAGDIQSYRRAYDQQLMWSVQVDEVDKNQIQHLKPAKTLTQTKFEEIEAKKLAETTINNAKKETENIEITKFTKEFCHQNAGEPVIFEYLGIDFVFSHNGQLQFYNNKNKPVPEDIARDFFRKAWENQKNSNTEIAA